MVNKTLRYVSKKVVFTNYQMAGSGSVAIIGISPGNSYFSERVIHAILRTVTDKYDRCIIVVPEVPDRHNFSHKPYKVACKKAASNARRVNKRIESALAALDADRRARIRIQPWDGVSPDTLDARLDFQHARYKMELLYASCPVLAADVDAYVENPSYLLDELAFFCVACALAEAEHCAIVYHRAMPLFEAFFWGKNDGIRRNLSVDYLEIK